MTSYHWPPAERAATAALGLATAVTLLSPLRQNRRPRRDQVDSFPLSYYPMFRDIRPRRVTISHAVGVDEHDGRHYLPDTVMVAGVGFNQARRQLNRAVKRGEADQYAEMLAKRVLVDPELSYIVRVEIVRGTFDLDTCLGGGGGPRCESIAAVRAAVAVGDRWQPPPPAEPEGTEPEAADPEAADPEAADAEIATQAAPTPASETIEPPPATGDVVAVGEHRPQVSKTRTPLLLAGALLGVGVAARHSGAARRLARAAGSSVTAAAPASRLGIARILTGGFTLGYLALRRRNMHQVNRTNARDFAPVGPVRILGQPARPEVADALNDATLATAALFTAGVWHRAIGPLHALLLTWTQSYRNSWSMVYHVTNTLVGQTIVLAGSPAADAASIDALRRRRSEAGHPRYAAALTLFNLVPAIAYLLAGLAKLLQPNGRAWVQGDALRRHVAINAVRKGLYGQPAGGLGIRLYPYRHLWTAAAIVTLVLELGAPLVLGNRRLGRFWAAGMLGLHWGIQATMRITFPHQMSGISFAAWFDLEKALPALGRLGRR